MKKVFSLLLFFSFCAPTEYLVQIRNTSGSIIGEYYKETRWLGLKETPNWKDLSSFSKLEILEFNATNLNSLQDIPALPKLRYLQLDGAEIQDLSPLQRFPKLDSLILNRTDTSDKVMLTYSNWNQLTRLELAYTNVSNLNFLGPGCSLRHLHLRNTKVSDLKPLSNCTKLTELYLRGTKVKDLSPLYGITGLIHLQTGGSEVSDEEIRKIRSIHPYLKIMPGLRKILGSETGLD
ncbi:leucine-rich repeat domain-containing protein [Leptospira semungkisensis]|uniref:Leucine-rich repeat domain-containing protein n=1 Tax=Leptospira semungkisensis TaxID=2484985 RepID=A0A4R9FYJ8_9LEPT|nr:leucine-rich repeat domain-containing protein [Leptospira semungkisensis]TGK03974.1 leucine-rich repeat domain-containing protein [Leptospira semungkisensis]